MDGCGGPATRTAVRNAIMLHATHRIETQSDTLASIFLQVSERRPMVQGKSYTEMIVTTLESYRLKRHCTH